MKPRRIVITANQYHPDCPSGANRLAYDEARFLAHRGHDVWMVVAAMASEAPSLRRHEGIHVLRYALPRFRGFDPRRRVYHQKAAAGLIAGNIPRPVDIIHGHALLSYMGGMTCLKGEARSCYSIHSPVTMEMIAEGRDKALAVRLRMRLTSQQAGRIERRCIRISDQVTSDSEYTKDLIGGIHGPTYAAKIRKVPGWVDLSRFVVRADRGANSRGAAWILGEWWRGWLLTGFPDDRVEKANSRT